MARPTGTIATTSAPLAFTPTLALRPASATRPQHQAANVARRGRLRRHPMAADGIVAVVVFALGILSDRIYYDIGAVNPHNFRFASGLAFMALLTFPLVFRPATRR